MNIEQLSLEELNSLLQQIYPWVHLREEERRQSQAESKVSVAESIEGLDALIGPDNPTTPTLNSLTEIQLFSQEELKENAGLALKQVFVGIELLARIVRDIAHSIE